MPEPYTESFTGEVARVWPGNGHSSHQIILRRADRSTIRFYTWDAWAGSFCQQAADSHRPIALTYSVTSWGKLIHDLDYAPELEPAS